MRTLLWLQNDLRLADNPGLQLASEASELFIVYCWPKPKPWCNLTGLGAQRIRFLSETLEHLRSQLAELGQDVFVSVQHPEQVLPLIVDELNIEHIITSRPQAFNERNSLNALQKTLGCKFTVTRGNTLYDEDGLTFSLADIPKHFTPFRKKMESQSIGEPLAPPKQLPPKIPETRYAPTPISDTRPHPTFPYRGGEQEALRRIKHWVFDRQAIATYKQTRNALDGLDNYSALSPWLATGAVSPRTIMQHVQRFENEVTANESTYWVFFELLWREFFYWRAQIDGLHLFLPYGVARKKQLRTFDPRQFTRWCRGETNYPLVNALMHQLVRSGFMSNRGRQIAASSLIHDLGVDWRYGAAFFEKHLIDFDVASNYGNWQYIAGVGSDPRGGRHFNIDKQTEQYDPKGLFITQWDGYREPQPEFVTDAADWPIS